ncbi:hypothetical protein ACFL3V_00670, partial [Nanoarchaeota archaeon]
CEGAEFNHWTAHHFDRLMASLPDDEVMQYEHRFIDFDYIPGLEQVMRLYMIDGYDNAARDIAKRLHPEHVKDDAPMMMTLLKAYEDCGREDKVDQINSVLQWFDEEADTTYLDGQDLRQEQEKDESEVLAAQSMTALNGVKG